MTQILWVSLKFSKTSRQNRKLSQGRNYSSNILNDTFYMDHLYVQNIRVHERINTLTL